MNKDLLELVKDKTILSLDLSLSSTGAFVWVDGGVHTFLIKGGKLKGARRLNYFRGWLLEYLNILNKKKLDLVIIEQVAHRSFAGTPLAELHGVMKELLFEVYGKIPTIIINPTTMKKFITGSGKAEKSEVKKKIFKKYGFMHQSDDIVDAAGLFYTGVHALYVGDKQSGELLKIIKIEK